MTDFKPINTQEEFDERIKERLSRAEKKIREEFKDWSSPEAIKKLKDEHSHEIESLNVHHSEALKKYEGYDEKFTAQEKKIHELEIGSMKTKIAIDKGLSLDATEFLQGDDEKSITESADRLAKLSAPTNVGFTRNTEAPTESAFDSELRELASKFAKN